MTKRNNFFICILALGVFGILTTEMGVIGILPLIADQFNVSVSKAGLLVSLFALVVSVSAPTMPLLFSGINRKKAMLLVLGVFVLGNIVSIFASNFTILVLARVIPAFFHPIYCSLALTVAASLVSKDEAPKAVSKIIMGVNVGSLLGVPIASFIASETSLEMAMVFFAAVNAIAFIAILIFVPSMPVKERLTYGAQLSVLKKPVLWLAIVTVIFINSAIYGVNSYIAEYLQTISNISGKILSFTLFVFGMASMIGNVIGGRLLVKSVIKTAIFYPIILGIAYMLSFITGKFTVPMMITVLLWGMLFSIGSIISQHWITSAAPEAPDFANGLFLASGNLGITIGTAVAGAFISGMGTQYVVLEGVLFLILSLGFILLRRYMYNFSQ